MIELLDNLLQPFIRLERLYHLNKLLGRFEQRMPVDQGYRAPRPQTQPYSCTSVRSHGDSRSA